MNALHYPSAEDRLASDGRGVPAEVIDEIKAFVNHGREPGSFTRAVLENDLSAACQACVGGPEVIFATWAYVFNVVPRNCYGAPEYVGYWIASKGGKS